METEKQTGSKNTLIIVAVVIIILAILGFMFFGKKSASNEVMPTVINQESSKTNRPSSLKELLSGTASSKCTFSSTEVGSGREGRVAI